MSQVNPSKWIACGSPHSPAAEHARHALELRMLAVCAFLPLAAKSHEDNVHAVHQLRVSCRRAVATLSVYKGFIPQNTYRKAKRWLQRIRRSANDARDDDVLLLRLASIRIDQQQGSKLLVTQVNEHRKLAQKPMVQMENRTKSKNILPFLSELPLAVAWNSNSKEPTVGEYAKLQLQRYANDIAIVTQGGLDKADQLHRLRILGKRLRYAMELFADAFAPEFRDTIYPQVENMQERLGTINDHATAQARFQRWVSDLPADATAAYIAEMIGCEWKQFQEERASFLAWWNAELAQKVVDRIVSCAWKEA